MKKLIPIILALFLVVCTQVPIADPICEQSDSYSFICETCHKRGIEPEDVYGMIYKGTAIAGVIDDDVRQATCAFSYAIGDWYVEAYDTYLTTYDDLLIGVARELDIIGKKDVKKAKLIKGILNPNLQDFASPKVIVDKDDYILRYFNNKLQDDLLCERGS